MPASECPPSRPRGEARPDAWFLGGTAAGALIGLLLAASMVAVIDPLLFFRRTAQASQPFFSLEREGNFSRYVYTGLMRNLDYEVLWLGPSYVTPFGRGADPQRELEHIK